MIWIPMFYICIVASGPPACVGMEVQDVYFEHQDECVDRAESVAGGVVLSLQEQGFEILAAKYGCRQEIEA